MASSLIRRIINAKKAPQPLPGAPYNQAVVFGDLVYLSGVLGMDPASMKLVPGGAKEEARQALKNIGHILEEAGSSYDKVIKSTIMLNDLKDFGDVNEVYREVFRTNFPARSTYQVAKLPANAVVEIEVIAGIGNVTTVTPKL